MENESERLWHKEFRSQGGEIVEKLKNDFNKHLHNAEKILCERDKELDKKEKDAKEKSDALDKRETILNRREKDLNEKLAMFETEKRILEDDKTNLAHEKEKWKIEEEALFSKYRLKDNVIKLKIGGKMFETYRSTVMRDPDSMLAIRFSGRHDPVLVDGAHFFDRDPKYFEYILNYLRDGNIRAEILPRNTDELYKILNEADYYQLRGLKEEVEKIIQQSNSNTQEAARMTMGRDTMTREMRRIAQDTMRTYSAEMEPDEQRAIEVVRECRKLKQDISTFQRGTRRGHIKEEIEKLYTSVLKTFPKEILIDPVVIRRVVIGLKSVGQVTGIRLSQERTLFSKVDQTCGQLQNMLPECLKGLPLRPASAQQELALNSEDLKKLQANIQAIDFRQIKCENAAKILWEVYDFQSMVQ